MVVREVIVHDKLQKRLKSNYYLSIFEILSGLNSNIQHQKRRKRRRKIKTKPRTRKKKRRRIKIKLINRRLKRRSPRKN